LAGRNTVTDRETDHDNKISNKKDGSTPATDNNHGSSAGAISGAPSGIFSSKHKFDLLVIITMALVLTRTVMVLSMDCVQLDDLCEMNTPYATNCHFLGVVLHSS
jgi:hypothetical protein